MWFWAPTSGWDRGLVEPGQGSRQNPLGPVCPSWNPALMGSGSSASGPSVQVPSGIFSEERGGAFLFLWITRFVVCPCFRQRGWLERLQGWEERGPSFCPAASPTAMAILVSPLRPCSKLMLWLFGDKILNPGMRKQEKLGQASLFPQLWACV